MKRSSKERHAATSSSAGGSRSNADKKKKAEISHAMLDMVTRGSLSFRILDSSPFRSLVDMLTTALDVTNIGTTIRADAKEAATTIKLKIAKELKGRMFCLKLDTAAMFVPT